MFLSFVQLTLRKITEIAAMYQIKVFRYKHKSSDLHK